MRDASLHPRMQGGTSIPRRALHEGLTQRGEHPMKCTLLTLALITAAGAAAAQSPPLPLIGNGNVSVYGAAASPPGSGAMLDTSVDLYRAQRIAATTPMKSDAVAALRSDVNIASAPAPAPRLTGATATAERLVELDGYKLLHDLQKGPDGRWYGNAMRGTTLVTVSVDRAGRVSTQ